MRKLTTYNRPPISELLAKAKNIDELRVMRGSLVIASMSGKLNASEKTEREWEHIFWRRVLELMLTPGGDCPTFIYNESLRWSKPPRVEEAIEMTLKVACSTLQPPALREQPTGVTARN